MENLSSINKDLDIVHKKYVDGIAKAKVDKVEGKGLSTNDFTNEEKQKLAGLSTLSVASSDVIGGVKSGTGITVDAEGNVSINDDSHNHNIYSYLNEYKKVADHNGTEKYCKILTITPYANGYKDADYTMEIIGRTRKKATFNIAISTGNDNYLKNITATYDGDSSVGGNLRVYYFADETSATSRIEVWIKMITWEELEFFPKTFYNKSESVKITWNLDTSATAFPTNATNTISVDNKSSLHTHNYAGSDSAGGAANESKQVLINRSASDAYYPILLTNSGDGTTVKQDQVYASHGNTVTMNPKTGAVKATLFEGTVKDNNITYGGGGLSGSISPIDAATITELSGNRLNFMRAADIAIEYSTNGGTSWTDYGAADADKRNLVSETADSYSINIGKKTSAAATTSDRVRITLTAANGQLYFYFRKLLIYVSTNGASGSSVLVEKANCGSDTTFTTIGTYRVSGWSGWNSIPINIQFGGSDSQTNQIRKIRLTFFITGLNSNTTYKNNLVIQKIRATGETVWGGDIAMSRNSLFSYDLDKNVTFPAEITANSFSGSGASLTSLNAANISSGTIAAARLPKASASAIGGIRVGTGLTIDSNGILSATGTSVDLSGYYTKTEVDNRTYTILEASTSNKIDFNSLQTEGLYFIKNVTTSTTTNAPSAGTSGNIFLEIGSKNGVIFQSVMTNTNNGVPYHRQYSSGTWSSWLSTIAVSMIRTGTLNSGMACNTPTADTHLANKKYVDDKVSSVGGSSTSVNSTVATSAWASNTSISGYSYRAAVTVSGVTTSNNIIVSLSASSTAAQEEACATAGIQCKQQAANTIYLFAKTKPTVSLTFTTIILG